MPTYKWRGDSRFLPDHNLEVEHNQTFTTEEKVNHADAEKVTEKAKAKPKPVASPAPQSEPAAPAEENV